MVELSHGLDKFVIGNIALTLCTHSFKPHTERIGRKRLSTLATTKTPVVIVLSSNHNYLSVKLRVAQTANPIDSRGCHCNYSTKKVMV